MNTRVFLNLALLALAFALIGFAILITRQNTPDTKKLVPIEPGLISKITIPRESNDIVFIRNRGQWLMKQPYNTRAHQFRVNMLLDFSQTPVDSDYDISHDRLKSLGLDTPRASIIFNDRAVHFGKTNPVNNKRYIQTEQTITLINDQLYPLISSQPSTFIDLKLFDPHEKIMALDLPAINLYKQDDGHWVGDGSNAIDADKIQTLVEHWQHAQAFAVHAYIARKKLANVMIKLENNDTVELEISDKDPWLILGHKQLGIEYHFDSTMYSRLFDIEHSEPYIKP